MDVELPNGVVIEDIPEGTTRAQIMERAIRGGLATEADFAETTPAPSPVSQGARLRAPTESPGMVQQMVGVGSPSYSLLRGAVIEPALGLNQLLAQTGLFGETVRREAQQNVERERAAYELGRQTMGREGFDIAQLGGALVSPVNRLFGAAPATTIGERIASGAGSAGLFSGLLPTAGPEENFAEDKLFQVGAGAVFGGLIPAVGVVGGKVLDFIRSLPVTAKNKELALWDYVQNLVGPEKDAVLSAFRNAGELVSGSRPTTAEAVSGIPSAISLVKEQQRLAGRAETAPSFLERGAEQAAARARTLEGAFGTQADLEAARAARAVETTPMREEALAQANVYGQVAPRLEQDIAQREAQVIQNLQTTGKIATEEAQALQRANTWAPVPGQPRFPARYSPNYDLAQNLKGAVQESTDAVSQRKAELAFKKLQLQSVKDEGFYPLSSLPLIDKIDASLAKTGEKSNALLVNSLQSLRNKLANYTDDNGIINSVDLYNIRKEIGDDIRQYMSERGAAGTFGAQATNVETSLKKLLDSSINTASGSNLWSEYLSKFASHSQKINRMEVGQEIIGKLNAGITDAEKVGAFASAVDNAASTIKRVTGVQRYDKLSDFLDAGQIKAVESVRADLARKANAFEMGKGVKGKTPEEGAKLNLLNRWWTIAGGVLDTLKRGSQAEFDKKITELMLDPQKMAGFLEVMPKRDSAKIAESIMAKLSPEARNTFASYLSIGEARLARSVIQQTTSRPGEPEMLPEVIVTGTMEE
jgi:hypothetical protein